MRSTASSRWAVPVVLDSLAGGSYFAAMYPILAIRAFFAALFGRRLPPAVLPQDLLPAQLPEKTAAPEKKPAPPAPAEKSRPETGGEPIPERDQRGPVPDGPAVQVLAVLQAEGRLLDFLSEDIDGYDDADIGAAVREVHRGCKKALADHFDLAPVRDEEEDALVSVNAGYDPAEVRLVGNIVGQPPFSGTLKHKGWRATAVRLPKAPKNGALVVQPAEVEV